MPGELILLVDDEPNIVELAGLYLEKEGYRSTSAADGAAALEAVRQHKPAAIVLDLMLPELDGYEVCRRLRAAGDATPIIMLTARDDDVDKIVGLEIGADDYMTKPFNPKELVARVKALLRRSARQDQPTAPLHLADLTVDPARREVTVDGQQVELRAQEFDLLVAFVQHQGLVMERPQLLRLAWGYDYYGETRTVDVHVAHLRKKLAGGQVKIETVTGVGYKLVA